MEQSKEEIRAKYLKNLASTGATLELCEFLADVLQCDSDMLQTTNKYHVEIMNHITNQGSIQDVTLMLQKIYKSYINWKSTIDDLEVRKMILPQKFMADQDKLNELHSFKALCSMQTNDMSLQEGEDVIVTDSSRPNQLKIRNMKGREAYLPLLSCFMPSPDINLTNCIERLQVQLTTYWTDTVSKSRLALRMNVASSLMELLECISQISVTRAITKFQERCRTFLEAVEEKDEFHLKYLAQALRRLENDFIKRNFEDTISLRDFIAELDKPILYHLSLVDKLLRYKQQLKSNCKPIKVQKLDSSALKQCQNKNIKYFEIKLTSIETTTREERSYHYPTTTTTPTTTTQTPSQPPTSTTTPSTGISRRCNIEFILDPRSGEHLSVKDAVVLGILDYKSGSYVNIETGEKQSIASAMTKGLIKVSRRKTAAADGTVIINTPGTTTDTATTTDTGTTDTDGTTNTADTYVDAKINTVASENTTANTHTTTVTVANSTDNVIVTTSDLPDSTDNTTSHTTRGNVMNASNISNNKDNVNITSSDVVIETREGGKMRNNDDVISVNPERLNGNLNSGNSDDLEIKSLKDVTNLQQIIIDKNVVENSSLVNENVDKFTPNVVDNNNDINNNNINNNDINNNNNTQQPRGLITLKTRVYRDEYEILNAFDHLNDRIVNPHLARDLGIIDGGLFKNRLTGETVVLDEAIRRGWLEAADWKTRDGKRKRTRTHSRLCDEVFKSNRQQQQGLNDDGDDVMDEDDDDDGGCGANAVTYAVDGVLDRVEGRYVSFIDAIKRNLLDADTGCYVDNVSKTKIFPAEAIRQGYMNVTQVETPQNTKLSSYQSQINNRGQSRNSFNQFIDYRSQFFRPLSTPSDHDMEPVARESAKIKSIAVYNVVDEQFNNMDDENNNVNVQLSIHEISF